MSEEPTDILRPIENEIIQYVHCGSCLAIIPDGVSPSEWASLDVGFSAIGLQVWCKRCDANLVHIDFENQVHPAICRQ